MPKQKRITANQLKIHGYRWKLKELTSEEKDWVQNGIVKYDDDGNPLKDKNGRVRRFERPDYQYYYKIVDGQEVKLFKVGDQFYWNGVRMETVDRLEIMEKSAKENAFYENIYGKLEDTKPPADTINEIVEEKPSKWPHVISLKGGPITDQKRPYNTMFPFFMEQVKVDGETVAARYKRNKENKELYEFEKIM